MTYNPSWTNGNGSGRLVSPDHHIHLIDLEEIGDALDRRRKMAHWSGFDFSGDLFSGAYVKGSTVMDFRSKLISDVLYADYGALGGSPPTPLAVDWTWPIDDGDLGKKLVGYTTDPNKVNLFAKLNGTGSWTDTSVSGPGSSIRAVHINELRQALEWTIHGAWQLPIYTTAGILSTMPDTPWIGDIIGNNGTDELRSVGWAVVSLDGKGIQNATARSSSIVVSADTTCTIGAYHCQYPVDFDDPPTWNGPWSSPGGLSDCTLIGTANCTPGSSETITGASTAFQAMLDGNDQNFMFRRMDTGVETITMEATFYPNFELNTPPN